MNCLDVFKMGTFIRTFELLQLALSKSYIYVSDISKELNWKQTDTMEFVLMNENIVSRPTDSGRQIIGIATTKEEKESLEEEASGRWDSQENLKRKWLEKYVPVKEIK